MKTYLNQFLFRLLVLLGLASSPAAAQLPVDWQAVYGGTNYDWVANVLQTGDGYLLAGKSRSGITGNKTNANLGSSDYWLVKVDTNGIKQWERSYGGIADDYLNWMAPATGGGYLLAGNSASGASGNKTLGSFGFADFWLLKVDAIGNQIFERAFGGGSNDYCYVIRNTTDGGYILGGESFSTPAGNKTSAAYGGFDFWVIKVDPNGMKEWEASFGGAQNDGLYDIKVLNDGYLLGGYSQSGISGNKTNANFGTDDYWIIKINTNGVKQWERVYGGGQVDVLVGLESVSDGGYALAGYSFSTPSGNKTNPTFGSNLNCDYWIVKVDANGVKQWERSFGGTNNDYAFTIIPAHGGGFLVGGYSYSGPTGNKTGPNHGLEDFWIVKIDENGNQQWDQVFGGNDFDDNYSILPTTDGGYLLAGESASPISGNKTLGTFGLSDIWLLKLAGNSSGNPSLKIARSGSNAILSWPSPSTGFALQKISQLGSTNWSNVAETPTDDGTNKTVNTPIAPTNTFFRLKK